MIAKGAPVTARDGRTGTATANSRWRRNASRRQHVVSVRWDGTPDTVTLPSGRKITDANVSDILVRNLI